jgi:excisionase family DNA binding protein
MYSNYITLQQVSTLVNVPLSTVRQWVREGKLHAVKVGKKYLTTKQQVEHDLGLDKLRSA